MESGRSEPTRPPDALIPADWWAGFSRAYPPLDHAPPDPLTLPAFARVSETGQALR